MRELPKSLEHLSDSELNALLPPNTLSDTEFAETEFSLRICLLMAGMDRDKVRPEFERRWIAAGRPTKY